MQFEGIFPMWRLTIDEIGMPPDFREDRTIGEHLEFVILVNGALTVRSAKMSQQCIGVFGIAKVLPHPPVSRGGERAGIIPCAPDIKEFFAVRVLYAPDVEPKPPLGHSSGQSQMMQFGQGDLTIDQ